MKSKAKQISTTVKRFGLDELDTERVTTVLCEDGSIWSRGDLDSEWTEDLPAFTGVTTGSYDSLRRGLDSLQFALDEIRGHLFARGFKGLDHPGGIVKAVEELCTPPAPPPTTEYVGGQLRDLCPACAGTGVGRRGFFTETCGTCGGSGKR